MNRKVLLAILLVFLAGALVLSLFLLERTEKTTSSRFCLGTYCTITVYGNRTKANRAITGIWDAITELENRISATLSYSEICKANANAGTGVATPVSEDTYNLVSFALEMGRKTGGALDCALGSLIDLWAIGTPEARIPQKSEIEALLPACKADNILIFRESDSFFIQITDPGTRIHLGAVGKGWAADLAAMILKEHGIKSASINLGGNIMVVGSCPTMFGSRPFIVGLQNPEGRQGDVFKSMEVKDLSVVTSGSYERSITGEDGHVYSHILDPQTGSGVETDILSVSVVGPSSAVCDALSTSFFVMGTEKAGALLESDFADYAAVFLVSGEEPSVVSVGNTGILR